MDVNRIKRVAEMLGEGFSPEDIAEEFYQEDGDTFFADRDDDSDEGVARRYGISADDRFDSRGRELLPRINEAGEPNWW